MELRHLRCFLAVAEELHFARIAERLHIDQSLLSRTIKELDKGLHDDLYDAGFSRAEDAGDGIVVTPAWEDELMMAVPARHPVLAFKQVPTKEVLRYPLTLGDPAICEGHACQIDRFLRTCGQEPLIAQYVATVDVMLVLVSAGLALGAAEVAENALQMGRSDTFALNSLRSLTPLPTASTVCGLWASALMTWPQNYRLQSWRCVSSQKQSIAAGQQTTHRLPGQPWRISALCAGAPAGRETGQTGEPAGLAVGAEAFRATAIASQTAEWSEHLDLRSHRPQKITEATRLPASSATIGIL